MRVLRQQTPAIIDPGRLQKSKAALVIFFFGTFTKSVLLMTYKTFDGSVPSARPPLNSSNSYVRGSSGGDNKKRSTH